MGWEKDVVQWVSSELVDVGVDGYVDVVLLLAVGGLPCFMIYPDNIQYKDKYALHT